LFPGGGFFYAFIYCSNMTTKPTNLCSDQDRRTHGGGVAGAVPVGSQLLCLAFMLTPVLANLNSNGIDSRISLSIGASDIIISIRIEVISICLIIMG
jgi:hypothetical protein